uniref:Carbonic anhydrase n=1 Tax=Rhizophora mucronata TaxID=61149 RepID=A0A2P2MY91_RHIMU
MVPQFSFSVFPFVVLFAVASAEVHELTHFTYSGEQGPDHWGSLSPSSSACSSGKSQSPVNIKKDEIVKSKDWKPLIRNYERANATLINNGFNVAVHYESDAGVLILDGKNYTLNGIHWHIPSEHQIDGVLYDAELHLVHQATSDKSLSVVSILFEYGDSDPFVAKLEGELDKLAKETCGEDEQAHIPLGTVDNRLLRKHTRNYYRYVGSLTTPPCTENVVWNILGKVRKISKEQVAALTAPLADVNKKNARPVQELNGRKVELYSELD